MSMVTSQNCEDGATVQQSMLEQSFLEDSAPSVTAPSHSHQRDSKAAAPSETVAVLPASESKNHTVLVKEEAPPTVTPSASVTTCQPNTNAQDSSVVGVTNSTMTGNDCGVTLYGNQVAGHGDLLKCGSDILKPLIPLEVKFYTTVLQQLPALTTFLPPFRGCVQLEEGTRRSLDARETFKKVSYRSGSQPCANGQFLALGDLTHGMRLPCVMDLKIGTRQHDDDEPEDKKLRKMAKCANSTSSSLGFRVCGIQVMRRDGTVGKKNKFYGRTIKKEDIRDALDFFLDSGGVGSSKAARHRHDLLPLFLEKLSSLQQIVEQQTTYRMFSSSLLLIYDAADQTKNTAWEVRMVDFAHSRCQEGLGRDEGYCLGIANVIALLERVRASGPPTGTPADASQEVTA